MHRIIDTISKFEKQTRRMPTGFQKFRKSVINISSPNLNPNQAGKVRILRRDPQSSSSASDQVDSASISNSLGEASADVGEGLYESARAKIFGEELASEVAMPETRINTKAKYRGLDNSAYDPDYCRESTMLAPQYSPRGPMFTAPVYSNNLPSSYPSLHQAYGPHRPNS